MKVLKIVPLALLIALVGCELINGPDDDLESPEITSFTASPQSIASPGEAVTLSWSVTGAVTELNIGSSTGTSPGSVSGSSVVVNPAATTTYTLTASNNAGDDDATTTVTVGGTTPPPPGNDSEPPIGTFSVSASAEGPFLSDQDGNITSPDDTRVLHLGPGSTFYARVQYSDPSGVSGIVLRLANSEPPGLTGNLSTGQAVGGFTLVGPVGDCDLASSPTSVDCTYQIQVGSDVVNINRLPDAGDEFAYVFRTNVTDALGNESNEPPRGYVTVGDYGGAPEPPEPPTPEPGENQPPNAAFTYTPSADNPNTITFDASASSDPDDDELTYTWAFGDGTTGTGALVTHAYAESNLYDVTLTVADPEAASDLFTQEIAVGNVTPPEE